MLGLHPRGHRFESYRDYYLWVVSSMVEQEAVNFEVIGSSPILPAMEKEILVIEDKSRIDKITFNHPELMNDKAEDFIREKYQRLISLNNTLHDTRDKVRSLEEEYKEAEKEWNSIKTMITFTHPSRQKEYFKESCSVGIRGHGNDIIGRTSMV